MLRSIILLLKINLSAASHTDAQIDRFVNLSAASHTDAQINHFVTKN
jgi:hypothetical protein